VLIRHPDAEPVDGDIFLDCHIAEVVRIGRDAAEGKNLEVQLMPVLLGQGRRLFEGLPPDHIELDWSEPCRHPASCISAMRSAARDRTDPALHAHVNRRLGHRTRRP
jgi:hypothetical protein